MSLPASAQLVWIDDLPSTSTPQPSLRSPRVRKAKTARPLRAFIWCFSLGLAFATGIWMDRTLLLSQPLALPLKPASAVSSATVRLCTAHAQRNAGFVTVTGSFCNITPHVLPHVQAVVELLNAKGLPIQVETAPVSFDPISPYQIVPFSVVLEDVPQAVSFRVRFRQLLGPLLN